MTEREQQIETVAHKLAAVWPSSVRDDDSLIVSLSARIVDALQGDPANEMEFGGDPDAESPFVIPSREGGAFPQGVGGARVDAAIAKRFASSPEQGDPADERQWTIRVDTQGQAHEAYWGVGAPRHIEVVPLARALRAEETVARLEAQLVTAEERRARQVKAVSCRCGVAASAEGMRARYYNALAKLGGMDLPAEALALIYDGIYGPDGWPEALRTQLVSPGFLPTPTGENE